MKKSILVMVCMFGIFSINGLTSAQAKVKGVLVQYKAQGVTLKGYLAWDDEIKGKRPGILVVHEWWGHNEYARKRARMLAELGYTALAVDMYGDGKQAMHPADASKFSAAVMKDFESAKARFNAALTFLKKQPGVEPDNIAAVGYCFGGGIVLNMARSGVDLKGVASFHGSLTAAVKTIKPGSIRARLLVLNGADDKFIKPEAVEAFKKEMSDAGADYKFINYPGAVHAFTNPEADNYAGKFNLPLGYNADADSKSWEEMKIFLREILK